MISRLEDTIVDPSDEDLANMAADAAGKQIYNP